METIISKIKEKISALNEKDRILIAIDGSCTAGKSTLASMLARDLDCNLFHMDDFFLRPAQRTQLRLSEIGGNVDYERFYETVLLPLKAGGSFDYRPYDCGTGKLKGPVAISPKRINIIEGSYSCHPYFKDPYDIRIFLKISPQIRLERIRQRPAFLQQRFLKEWIPMEQAYFAAFAIEEKADIVALPADNR